MSDSRDLEMMDRKTFMIHLMESLKEGEMHKLHKARVDSLQRQIHVTQSVETDITLLGKPLKFTITFDGTP